MPFVANSVSTLQQLFESTVLCHQHPVTGLIPSSEGGEHAWVRDNTYCALTLWALSMAVKRSSHLDEDLSRCFEMEQRVIKCMRGLLYAMLRQREKVELFKRSQSPSDSLHAKYNTSSGQVCVGDGEWGHLQIDATSLFLLALAQMTAAGLQIVFTLDEVAFVQNLVFYIESAYFTADYGVWERGDKTNHGQPELNASSIGMAMAAMQAINQLDMFGSHGGSASVVHVMPDEVHKCEAVLHSMLPRESLSKEVDSALLAVIGFPAFAVSDARIIADTRHAIIEHTLGRYGCKRFLRDGYMTCREDRSRLYYEPWEMRHFENIECQWPLFFAFLAIDAAFSGDAVGVERNMTSLESVMVPLAGEGCEPAMMAVPEMYAVSADSLPAELASPGSQSRQPIGRCPFFWAQSVYVLAKLLQLRLLEPAELDPLNRRLAAEKKPDVVVQVCVLAENALVQRVMAEHHDLHVQTVDQVRPAVEIRPARVLARLFTQLGRSVKLQLTGRSSLEVGTLSTSILYSLQSQVYAFTPQFTDTARFFFASDTPLAIDTLTNEINFLQSSWTAMMGRPLVTIVFAESQLCDNRVPSIFMQTLRKLQTGYVCGARVQMGSLQDFVNTSCMYSLAFLNDHENGRSDTLSVEMATLLHATPPVDDPESRTRRPSLTWRPSVDSAQDPAFYARRRRSVRRLSSGLLERSVSADPLPALGPVVGGAGEAPVIDYHCVRGATDVLYADLSDDEVLQLLRQSLDSLEERADLLHCLAVKHGLSCQLPAAAVGGQASSAGGHAEQQEESVTVRVLYQQLYRQACSGQHWALARHSAGMLGHRLADLAKAVTDLLVRQKQLTVGAPPDECAIVSPLPAAELTHIIHAAYGKNETTAMLTQELLLYMSMLIRTEPQLFSEMIRLRTGLIIQVMSGELQRLLHCSPENATQALVNLSPFNMKNLLYHVLSGKDFHVQAAASGHFSVDARRSAKVSRRCEMPAVYTVGGHHEDDKEEEEEEERSGQWLRRRRLDGALNRMPVGFCRRLYDFLARCDVGGGLLVADQLLSHALTEEMTAGEPKFALRLEAALTRIGEPEMRQLTVEALMVVTLLSEHATPLPSRPLNVRQLVASACRLFLDDQKAGGGDATLCCAGSVPVAPGEAPACGGAAGVCRYFYDSAPSGRHGTMLYMVRALAHSGLCLPTNGVLDCNIC